MNQVWFRVNAPQVIHESIDGEVIIINLETGSYYSVKGSGADVWDVLQGTPAITTTTVVDTLAQAYEAPREAIAAAVDGFVGQLVAEGLLAETEGSTVQPVAAPASSDGGAKPAFELPRLEKYTDMQDLVLLDPVHEVDEQGWPQQPPEAGASAA